RCTRHQGTARIARVAAPAARRHRLHHDFRHSRRKRSNRTGRPRGHSGVRQDRYASTFRGDRLNTMWCCYRLGTLQPFLTDELQAAATTFSAQVVLECGGSWTMASARAKDSVDIWYCLPRLPSDAAFAPL